MATTKRACIAAGFAVAGFGLIWGFVLTVNLVWSVLQDAAKPRALGGPVAIREVHNGLLNQGFIGIEYESVPKGQLESLGIEGGVIVNRVIEGSPADSSGIAVGDMLVKADGVPITGREQLRGLCLNWIPGQIVKLTIVRRESKATVERIVEPRLIRFDEMRELKSPRRVLP